MSSTKTFMQLIRQNHITSEVLLTLAVEDPLDGNNREVEIYATVIPRSRSSYTKGYVVPDNLCRAG